MRLLEHTQRRPCQYDSCERMISSTQIPLPDNIQHSQQNDIHAPGGIRTHNLSRREAADLRLRPRDHWDRQYLHVTEPNLIQSLLHASQFNELTINQLPGGKVLLPKVTASLGIPHILYNPKVH
jgi:hypothetical protein